MLSALAFVRDGFFFAKILVLAMAGLMLVGCVTSASDKRTGLINPWTIFALSFIQYYFLGPLDTFFFHDIMTLATVLMGSMAPQDDAVIVTPVLSSLIGLAFVMAGYHAYMLPAKQNLSVKKPIWYFSKKRLKLVVLGSFLIGLVSLVIFFQQVGFITYVSTDRSLRYFLYSDAATFGFFSDFLSTSIVFLSVHVIEAYIDRPRRALLFIVLAFIPFIYFNISLFSGSRITVVRPGLIIAFYWILRKHATKFSWRIAALFAILLVFLVASGVYRQSIGAADSFNATLVILGAMTPALVHNYATQSMDFTTAYDIFLLLHNRNYNLGMGDTYLKLLYQFIPRSLWPEKPDNITVVMSKIFRPEQFEIGVSYNPTLLGEMYYNFGLAGVIVGCFLVGMCIAWLYRFGRRNIESAPMTLIYVVLVVSIIEHGRGAFSNITMTYLLFYLTPIFLAIRRSPLVVSGAVSYSKVKEPQT